MSCDLDRLFGPLEAQIPTSEDEEIFFLSAGNLPIPLAEMSTDRIVIARGYHEYLDYYRADLLTVQAEPKTYARLALLILAGVFHADPLNVELHLTHSASHIKRVAITYEGKIPDNWRAGYVRQPRAYGYEVAKLDPYNLCHVDPHDLPCFYLGPESDSELLITVQDWDGRNVVNGFGRDTGCVRLADHLLNLSRTNPDYLELELEGFAGRGGVGPMSAEVSFWLPGHRNWTADLPHT